jgi:uncharacterized protein (TIGR04255 family)
MTDCIVTFASPPVVEVVAGVAFDGLSAETSALLAAFWKDRLRDKFPSLQQQPPYSPPDERFPGGGRAFTFNLNLFNPNLSNAFPAARLWVQSNDGQQLLQLQPGWFACNWRKVDAGQEYDRWPSRRSAFQQYFTELSDYLEREGVGQPKIRQCEVTYINHITPSATWSSHGDFSKIFRIGPPTSGSYPLEQMSAQFQYALIRDDLPYGRLHTQITPAFGPDGKVPLYVFELTARGAPLGDNIEGALAFLDRGREAVDRTFVALTTDAMHAEWGLQS